MESYFLHTFYIISRLDPASIALYRYSDPILGARITPVTGDIFKGIIEIPTDSTFNVDVKTGRIEVSVTGNVYSIGDKLIYIEKSLEQ